MRWNSRHYFKRFSNPNPSKMQPRWTLKIVSSGILGIENTQTFDSRHRAFISKNWIPDNRCTSSDMTKSTCVVFYDHIRYNCTKILTWDSKPMELNTVPVVLAGG